MSCSCNAKYDNKVPCCCSTGKPVLCTTTECPDTQPCNETIESDCVIYHGDGCEAIAIEDGMTVTHVVDTFLGILNLLDCTTTTTTTEDPGCQCYKIFNSNTTGIANNVYSVNCSSYIPITTSVQYLQTIYLCSFLPITSDNGVQITNLGGICSDRGGQCFPPASYCYTIAMNGYGVFQYTTSQGILTTVTLTNEITHICAWNDSIIKIAGSGTMTVTNSENFCSGNNDCVLIPYRCTGTNYGEQSDDIRFFAMEKLWEEPQYQFQLINCTLNGINYATGQNLLVYPPGDLVVALGLNGIYTYVQNINIWLNSLTFGSEFTFYDNMGVIDTPFAGSTYTIHIKRYVNGDPTSLTDYYYSNDYGFAFNTVDNTYGMYSCFLTPVQMCLTYNVIDGDGEQVTQILTSNPTLTEGAYSFTFYPSYYDQSVTIEKEPDGSWWIRGDVFSSIIDSLSISTSPMLPIATGIPPYEWVGGFVSSLTSLPGECPEVTAYCFSAECMGPGDLSWVGSDKIGQVIHFDALEAMTVNVCAEPASVNWYSSTTGTALITGGTVVCTSGAYCGQTPARCTAGNGGEGQYYIMERAWNEPIYTFTLNNFILNGIEYATGQVLTVNAPGDLIVGTSPIDGLSYTMNINDWLNDILFSIFGSTYGGWYFYDDMHVIDKPNLAATYSININNYYYYSSQYGFSIGAAINTFGSYTCSNKPLFAGAVTWGEDGGTACGGSLPIVATGDGVDFCSSNTFTGSGFSVIGTGGAFISYGGQIKTVNHVSGDPFVTFNGGCDPC